MALKRQIRRRRHPRASLVGLAVLVFSTLLTTQSVLADSLYPYPFPYERNRVYDLVPSYRLYPYSTVGKLFFEDTQTNTPKQCSAAVINAPNKSLIVTAAHCIHSGGSNGHFYSWFSFAPMYDNGSMPFGAWGWRSAWVPDVWTKTGDFQYDFGVIVLATHNGNYVQDIAGSLGYLANAPHKQHWHIEGYPKGGSFTGADMVECTASWAADGEQGETIGAGCDMAAGALGGPWITNFSGNSGAGKNQVNGVSSYKQSNPDEPEAVYSGQFNNMFVDVYNGASTQ
ncbi:MAG TPA: hypothetical protein VN193_15240 [Candidatus Angelobacter sp.]|jgi:V8-like Glu-specific endopeptidase|nr:hypothetical protein [Candidatus Angelobacter sp.]